MILRNGLLRRLASNLASGGRPGVTRLWQGSGALRGCSRHLHGTRICLVKGTEVTMPSLSPTMTEGTIVKWLKKEGEKIEPGDVICEIQTDKAVVAFEMEDEAILAKILVPDDTKDVKIGTLIAMLVEEGEDWKEVEVPERSTPSSSPSSTPSSSSASSAPAKDEPQPQESQPSMPSTGSGHGLLGPSVRNLLMQYGLDSSKIPASGPHEVLLKGDVLNYIKQHNMKPKSVEEMSHESQKTGASKREPEAAAAYTDIETSNMRKVIAKRLTLSKTSIPHVYMTADCRVNGIIKERLSLKKAGVAVSVNDFIIKAAGISLKKVPQVNAFWNEEGNTIEMIPNVDISIAVATPAGLITPIIQNANQKSVTDINKTVKELAEKAKQGKLQPHEFQGGSFSISNLGMFGITEFVAVINPPQSAIMAVGTSRLVLNEKGQLDQLMSVTLSFDGRVIDEEMAAKFLETFKQFIEDPALMDRTGDGSDYRRLNALTS